MFKLLVHPSHALYLIDYSEKHFGSCSHTRDDEDILSIHRSKIEEAIKGVKRRKAPEVDGITVKVLEMTATGSGAEALFRLFREL